jgi:hypothetical protein
MRVEVPFYANEDKTHCFQACLRMMLKYFLPEREFTLGELDVISAKVEGLWTWPTAAALWLVDNGFEVRNVETFDYKEFVRKGGDYLLSHFGENVGQAQIDHSDIAQEIKLAGLFNQKIISELRIPEIADLRSCLDDGYLLGCNVNSHRLSGVGGYSGHFVVIIGYDEESLLLHDPGLPARQNLRISNEVFERAWAYPDSTAKNYLAIKLQR